MNPVNIIYIVLYLNSIQPSHVNVAKWVFGYPGVSDARGPVQLGERHPAAEGEVYRFFLEKLLLGERKTSGC